MSSSVRVLSVRGELSLLGVAGSGEPVEIDSFRLLQGRVIRGSVMGHSAPAVLIERILAHYRRDAFPLEHLVSTYPMSEINEAVQDSLAGRTVKAVLVHQH